MSHPNLSNEINRNIAKSSIEGGVWLNLPEESAKVARAEALEQGNIMKVGTKLLIQTQSTLYTLEKRGEDEYYISGSLKYCPEPTRCRVHGSTFGGSMLKLEWVGRGMHLEFSLLEGPHSSKGVCTVTTNEIREITEIVPDEIAPTPSFFKPDKQRKHK